MQTEDIKIRIDIIEYLSKDYQLEKIGSGSYRINPCPFCGHRDCMTVFEHTQSWKCFSCGEGGDIFSFVMKRDNIDFATALERLAKVAGVKLDKENKNNNINKYKEKEEIQKIFESAVKYYQSRLLKNETALKYLRDVRKRTDRVIKRARYGFTGKNPKLYEFLIKKGFVEEIILKSGLVKKNNNKLYDFFGKNLFIYPVYFNNKPVDFFCKDYFEKDKSKRRDYQLPKRHKLNNPVFYGKNAFYKERFIIVEGPEDRLSILQKKEDIPVVAILGQLSEDQLGYIERLGEEKTIYLAFDPDSTGEKYERKILERLSGKATILKMLWDYKEGDIDDYLRGKKAEALEESINLSQDAIRYYINNLPKNLQEMHPKTAEAYWYPIAEWIAGYQSSIARMSYMELLAEKMGGKTRYLTPIKTAIRRIRKETDRATEDSREPMDLLEEKWGLVVSNNRYIKIDADNKNKLLSKFTIKIQRYIENNNEIFYECILTNEDGITSPPVLFNSKSRVNVHAFKELCGNVGSYYFRGKDSDLPDIWEFEEKRANIKKRTIYYQRYGYIPDHNMWLFENCAIINGKVYEKNAEGYIETAEFDFKTYGVNVYSGDKPEINYKDKIDRRYIEEIIFNWLWMMDSRVSGEDPTTFKAFLLLGYVYTLAYLPELLAYDKKFPFIMIYGASGTGKTEVMQLLMHFFGFHNVGENWGESTAAGISMAIEELSCLPFWQEEYKNTLGQNRRQQKKVELVNNIYNRTSSGKGGLERRSIKEVNATLLFTGQDRPEDKAFLSRSIIIDKELPTSEATEAYYFLKREKNKFSAIFLKIIKEKDEEKKKKIIHYQNMVYDYVKNRLKELGKDTFVDERAILNYCKIAAGWFMWEYENDIFEKPFLEWIVQEIIEDVTRKTKEDILIRFFEDVDNIFEDIGEVATIRDGYLYMRFGKIYQEWKREGARTGLGEYLSKNAMIDYLRKDPLGYWEGEARIYIRDQQRRVIKLKYEKLPTNIKYIIEDWK